MKRAVSRYGQGEEEETEELYFDPDSKIMKKFPVMRTESLTTQA